MGILVQVQLYTFDYRKALFRPQKMAPQVQPKCYGHPQQMIKQPTIEEKKHGHLIKSGHTETLI